MITIIFSGRTPVPEITKIGMETDQRAETLRLLLPQIAEGQHAQLCMILPDGRADALLIQNGLTVIPSTITEIPGRIRAWVEIVGGDNIAWNSEILYLDVGDLPPISEQIEKQYPTAFQDAIQQTGDNADRAEAAVADLQGLSAEGEVDPERATDVEYDSGENKLKFYFPNYPIVWMDENGVLNIQDATGPLQPGETRLLWEFPNDFAQRVHTHPMTDITGLADALAGKAAAQHTHTAEEISGLEEDVEDMVQEAVAGLVPEISGASVTLTAAGWTGAEAPYTQTVSCDKAKADNHLITGPGSLTAAQHAAMVSGQIICTGQAAGEITFKAFGEKPDTDIPVNVLAIG